MENSELSFPKNNKQQTKKVKYSAKFLKSHVPFPCKNRGGEVVHIGESFLHKGGGGGKYSFSLIMYGFSNSLLSKSFI